MQFGKLISGLLFIMLLLNRISCEQTEIVTNDMSQSKADDQVSQNNQESINEAKPIESDINETQAVQKEQTQEEITQQKEQVIEDKEEKTSDTQTQENVDKKNQNVEEKKPKSQNEIKKDTTQTEIINNEQKIKKDEKNEVIPVQIIKDEKEVQVQKEQTVEKTENEQQVLTPLDKKESKTNPLIWGLIFTLMVIGIAVLGFMSFYYRLYMYRNRKAPFEVPSILNCLFPKPINYEHEITVLCSKYMNN